MRAFAALALSIAALLGAGFAWRERERARHLALPVLADPSLPAAPAAALGEAPACEVEEVARLGPSPYAPAEGGALAGAGPRITAVLATSGGELWIGTFDEGLWLSPPRPGPAFSPRGCGGGRDAGAACGERGGEGREAPAAVPGLAGRERFVNALAEHDGMVWAATQGGLVAFDGSRRALTLLEGEGVTALVRAGASLFAGTARGLVRASVERGAEPLAAAGPAGEPLRVTALAASGVQLFVGTASGAYALPLAALDAPLLARTARWHPLVFGEPPAETNVVTALAPLDGGVVAGTDDGGLVRIREDGGVMAARFADPRANEVNPGAAATAGGVLLFGTQGGGLLLARERGVGLEVGRLQGLERGEISAVSPDGAGALVGTARGEVLRVACGGRRTPDR